MAVLDNGTILIIDKDEALNAKYTRTLERRGYAVQTAFSLMAAKDYLARASPDVIILDVVLPDGNGIDFCGEIYKATNAYILFISSSEEYQDKINALDAGGTVYLNKPCPLDELAVRVKAAMRRRKTSAIP